VIQRGKIIQDVKQKKDDIPTNIEKGIDSANAKPTENRWKTF